MKYINNKLKLLIIVLVLFSCLLIYKSKSTYGIYRDTFNTQIYLSVLDPERTYTVTLHAGDGEFTNGSNTKSFAKTVHEPVGKFETPTNPGYNFIGWYTAPTNGTKISIDEPVEADVHYYAHWAKIVCKKAQLGTLHENTCYYSAEAYAENSNDKDYGCHKLDEYNDGDKIRYGIIPTTDSPMVGYAYDCDVNDDGTFDSLTERFYYVREIDETLSGGVDDAVLVHYTTFDKDGQVTYAANSNKREIYQYDAGKAYLPNSTTWPTNDPWDNPALVDFDGKVARYINITDLDTACGDLWANDGLLDDCQFFMEISRFESNGVGRSGIWVEKINNNNRRIDSRTRKLTAPGASSSNSVRPVIEIPFNTLEGYKERDIFDVTFVSNGGTGVNHRQRYEDQPIGELSRSLRDGYTFRGWYYDNGTFQNEASATDLVSSNIKLYAKWEEWTPNMEYVFHIPGTCTFGGNSNNITSASNNCISTINPSGSSIDYTATANKYIDTNISLYDSTNYNKDYEVGFTIQAYNSSQGDTQATFVSSKVETNPYPGMVIRKATGDSNRIEVTSTVGTEKLNDIYKHTNPITSSSPMNVVIARRNGIIYYSFNGSIFKELSDLSTSEPDLFNMNTWFGATVVGGTKTDTDTSSAQRYLTGTLSNLYIKLEAEQVETVQVNFNGHDATTLEFASKTVNKGGYIGTLPLVTKTGFRFNGWFTEATGGREIDETEVINSDGLTFHAQYTPLVLVTFEVDGGTLSISPNTVEVPVGETIGSVLTNNTLPTVTKTGKVFTGWYTTATTGGRQIDETEVINDVTSFYARYVDAVTLTFNGNGATPSYASKTVGAGLPIDELPTVSLQDYEFVGWFVDDGNGNPSSTQIQEGDVVNEDTDLVAKWVMSNAVALIGDTPYETLAAAINAVDTGLSHSTKITILKDIVLTSVVTIPSDTWVELDIGEYTISGSSNSVVLFSNSGTLDIINGTITGNGEDVIANTSTGTINISGGEIRSTSTESRNIIENTGGAVNITGGRLITTASGAAINVTTSGTLEMSGGRIETSGPTKSQAIYNNGGTVTISGTAYLHNTTTSTSDQRATLHNNAGTMTILGGTIISDNYIAVDCKGTVIVGNNNDGIIDITTPVLRGKDYGLKRTSGTVKVYDGIFESFSNTRAINGTVADKPTGIDFTDSTIDVDGVTYHSTYLLVPVVTVRFDANGGTVEGESYKEISVNNGATVGSEMPDDPVKANYYFTGWYDGNNSQITSSTPITMNVTAYAKWVQDFTNGTVPTALSVELNDTENIVITGTDLEDVTYSSSDSSVASVDADGTVHGLAVGSATITITGTKSNSTRTVTVTVTPIMRDIRFYDAQNGNLITTVSVEDGTSIDDDPNLSMPANPTDTNYVFAGWAIEVNNALTTFTSATEVTGDVDVIGTWKEKVSYFTVTTSPSPFVITAGNTGTITLNETVQNDEMENFNVASGDSSVATVSVSGNVITVTAVSAGTTNIVLTGTLSNASRNIEVEVEALKHSVTFMNGESIFAAIEVEDGTTISGLMPNNIPTKTDYIFDGWFIGGNTLYPVTSSTTVDNDIVADAVWTPSINLATVPATLTVTVGSTNTISITNIPSGMESYTFASADSSYATVDQSGVVTGVAPGTVNVTVTGSRSNIVKTVEVTVANPVQTHTITFYTDSSKQTAYGSQVTVEHGDSIDDTQGASMPSPNPTKTNYVFAGWAIDDGNSLTPFTSATEVLANIDVIATWKEKINIASVTPSSIAIGIGDTETITVGPSVLGEDVETYTFSSSASGIASVNSNGVVTGVAVGTATVTVTGDSGETQTVSVAVSAETLICKKATVLHSSGGNSFGTIPTTDTPLGGYAYDCDVDGDGDYTGGDGNYTERFYYLTSNNGYGVFIFYNNTTQTNGELSIDCTNGDLAKAYSASPFTNGPTTAAGELPTTSQWTNVTLHSTPRQMYNELGGTTSNGNNLGTYDYAGKAARFATLDEIKAATTTSLNGTGNELVPYLFLLENTASYASGCRSNYWLETPMSSASKVYRINGSTSGTTKNIGNANGNSGVRPVIEVPENLIEGLASTTPVPSTHEITFYTDSSKQTTWGSAVTVDDGSSIASTQGASMPANPTKTNYIFVDWVYDYNNTLTPFTSATEVFGDIDVIARWKEQINIATIPDSPMSIMLGANKQIVVTATGEGNLVEDYTLSSSNTNYVEVNGKTITGASLGSVTLTIEGVTSHQTRTITVNVVNSHNVTFDPDNGDTSTVIQVEVGSSIDDSGETLPVDPTKDDYVFDNWYIYDETNETLTNTRLDTTATVTSDIIYKAKWVSNTYVAATYGSTTTYHTTLQSAFSAAPTNGPATEVKLLQDIINPVGQTRILSGRSIILNGGKYKVQCGESTTKQMIFNEGGTLRVISGTYLCDTDTLAVFENNTGRTMYVDGGWIENTSNSADNARAAIYNNGAVEITGGTFKSGAPKRGVVQNAGASSSITMSGGTVIQTVSSTMGALENGKSGSSITITGGTVTSVGNAINNVSGTTLIVGTQNNTYDVTSPVIQGDLYGINSAVNYSIYDGIIKGKSNNKAVNDFTKITGTETNSTRQTGTDGAYYTLYYEMPQDKYRINFDPGAEGTVSPSYLDYQLNTAINISSFPTPTRANYNFDGWYTDSGLQTPATSFTPTVTGEVTYYAKWSSTYRINFNPGTDGSVTTSYLDYPLNTAIDGSNFPTPTRAHYNFVGWYTDSNTQTAFATFTPTAYGETTYFAKWAYASSLTPVTHNVLGTAMQQYFTNVSSWVTTDATDPSNPAEPYLAPQTKNDYDNGHHLFKASIEEVFAGNSCSYCAASSGSSTRANNDCNNPSTGTYCDQPGGYDTGLTDNLNVYLYENGEKDENIVSYITSTGGKIYNMIPGVTYYWESATDNTKYGVVTATGSRRTLKTAVRNLRDLGGLTASNSDVSGTIDYGRLYRGAQITSAQGVTDLTKLGITREMDLRGNGDGNQTYKMANYDTGTSSSYTDIVMTNYIVNPIVTPYITSAHLSEYRAVKTAMRAIMEKVVFNHDSIYFHCTIGTDRTGTMAYFLEGLLGVSEEDRLRDYEMTYFFGLTNRTRFHDTSGWSNTAPRFYSMYRSYPTNADIYNYYTYESHTPDPNDPNDLTDDELLRRFRLELIH